MNWWTALKRERHLHKDPPITYWNDLRGALRCRHIPSHYNRKLMDKLQRLHQRNLSVEEYWQKMVLYPDLIRLFYTNLKFKGNNLVSHVKGVDMKITHDVWAVVTGLKYAGLKINKGNIGVVEDFNKIQYYKSCLKNPQAQVKTCSVGGLKLDERVLALIVTWILTPRGSHHFVLTE